MIKLAEEKKQKYPILYSDFIAKMKNKMYLGTVKKYGWHIEDSTLQGIWEHLKSEVEEIKALLDTVLIEEVTTPTGKDTFIEVCNGAIDPDSFDFLQNLPKVTQLTFEMMHVLQCSELFIDLLMHKRCKAVKWQTEIATKRGEIVKFE